LSEREEKVMATFNDPGSVRDLIESNGLYQGPCGDDPQPIAIYRYTHTQSADPHFMVSYHSADIPNMMASPFVEKPVLLWSRYNGITEDGRRFVDGSDAAKIRAQQDQALLDLLWPLMEDKSINGERVTQAGLVAVVRHALGVF